jgi:hypothetical protein
MSMLQGLEYHYGSLPAVDYFSAISHFMGKLLIPVRVMTGLKKR